MKATGIVRRIDELGRIVIPKEIRRSMHIREGDPLEIFVNNEGELIFRKYSPLEEFEDAAAYTADAITAAIGHSCLICDRDKIIYASGIRAKEFMEKNLNPELDKYVDSRKPTMLSNNEEFALFKQNSGIFPSVMIFPILNGGDCYGSVIILSTDPSVTFTQTEIKVGEAVSDLMGRQI